MKTKYVLKGLLVAIICLFTVTSCTKEDELITELSVEREFAPVGLSSIIRTQTTVELTWDMDENVDNYVVEISEDEAFTTLNQTVNVTFNELPVQILLAAETLYYIRVKAVSSRGLQDSKWSTPIMAQTLTEQIFLPIQPGDIASTQALLRWVPNSVVTEILIMPGNITRTITPEEKINGIATLTGLSGETQYIATLLNGANIRGVRIFTTEVDASTGNVLTPADDLFQRVADASPGDILLLEPGDYTAQIGVITIDKSLTIRGLLSYNKPFLKVGFDLSNGATDVSLIDLDLTGDLVESVTDVIDLATAGNYNSLLIRGCNIQNYDKSLIKGQTTDAIIQTVVIENCVVSNFPTNSADFIDFRGSDVLNISVKTSTFNNCAPSRDFFRIDAAGTSNGNATVNVLLENCTLYACANNNSRRIFYVRFISNEIISRNNLITDTVVEAYSDQSSTDEFITFDNNNYFNAPTLYDPTVTRFDNTTTYFTLNPGFANAAGGDFSVSNQTLIDNNIGDPRWLQ